MGRLADKIKNLMKKSREPVVGDIEMDDEPTVGDIEMLDDDDADDGIVVISAKDLKNEDDDESEKFADESQEYGNKEMNKRRPKTSTEERVAKYSSGEQNEREDRMRSHARGMNEKNDDEKASYDKVMATVKSGKDEMRGKNNKISDKDEAPSRNAKLAQMLGKKYARR